MSGNKDSVLFCLPLGVGALVISFVMTLFLVADAVTKTQALWEDRDDQTVMSWLSLGMSLVTFLCCLAGFIGTLIRSAGLLKIGAYFVYPSIISTMVSCLLMWLKVNGMSGDLIKQYDESGNLIDVEDDRLPNSKWIAAGIVTALDIIVLLMLCYMGDIFISAAKHVETGKSIWKRS
ncbi:putative transmembrane protein [Gregarina niphandrodes]|uniref:Transmembrane protein n=1 Tax=Gregarina niphandrodes TaxID=110365 RepID=A0A023BAF9_GRENI|nr:putative transmembrane protein [Gregarina niphandrodes]EZG78199.1 putative transmembrane protein [Gregarina niphandrodes]|eukprot:XP_011129419.1 putative transmembrane protein [Gregarina niphandrodes]